MKLENMEIDEAHRNLYNIKSEIVTACDRFLIEPDGSFTGYPFFNSFLPEPVIFQVTDTKQKSKRVRG